MGFMHYGMNVRPARLATTVINGRGPADLGRSVGPNGHTEGHRRSAGWGWGSKLYYKLKDEVICFPHDSPDAHCRASENAKASISYIIRLTVRTGL